MSRQAQQLAAVDAVAGGRFDEAARLIQELLAAPPEIRRGICRYCGCTEARGCAVLILHTDSGFLDAVMEPNVARCEWVDPDCTICSNVSCIERWRRDSPAEIDVDIHDASAAAASHSRIVRP